MDRMRNHHKPSLPAPTHPQVAPTAPRIAAPSPPRQRTTTCASAPRRPMNAGCLLARRAFQRRSDAAQGGNCAAGIGVVSATIAIAAHRCVGLAEFGIVAGNDGIRGCCCGSGGSFTVVQPCQPASVRVYVCLRLCVRACVRVGVSERVGGWGEVEGGRKG